MKNNIKENLPVVLATTVFALVALYPFAVVCLW
jgi:hypothetical protein